ncbi:MAG: alpha-amylase family glycosyl hydrolase [Silvibacterium sp.]
MIYQIITDRFYDGDPSNNDPPQSRGMYDSTKTNWQAYWGGDFAGIQAKLPYLKKMGVTAIWISPSVDNINVPMMGPDGKPIPYLFAPYHGYINRDFMRVEEHFGSSRNDWKAFDAMTAAAHADGIKIILDFSPNDSNLINTAAHGALYDNGKLLATYGHDPQGMFHHEGTLTDINDAYQVQYYNVFGLADLNEDNPTIDRYIKDSIHQFQDHGVDAVRLDAVKHITWGWSYSFANSLYTYKPSFMFAEWFMGGINDKFYPDACKFANKSGMSLLDYPLAVAIRDVFANDKGFSAIQTTLEAEDHDFERPNDLATFVDNHDIPRLLTLNHNENRLNEATAFVLTSRGIPIIYYGDEQYLHSDTNGGRDPYTRVWMSSYNTNTVGFRLVKRLAASRQTNDALAYGSMEPLWVKPDVFIFERRFANDVVMVAINKSEHSSASIPELKTGLPPGKYRDYLRGMMSGSRIHVRRDANSGEQHVDSFTLAPHSVAVWQSARVAGKPEVGSIGPAIGQPGMQVTLAGEQFGSAKGTVLWGNTAAPIRSWSNETVTLAVPAVPNGHYKVQLKTATGEAANTIPFTVLQGKLIPVTFTVKNVPAAAGASVYLTGNTVEIGQWNTASNTAPGPFLCPHAPTCFLDISVPAGKRIEFKLFQLAQDGSVHWASGGHHVYMVPDSGTGALEVDWQQ